MFIDEVKLRIRDFQIFSVDRPGDVCSRVLADKHDHGVGCCRSRWTFPQR